MKTKALLSAALSVAILGAAYAQAPNMGLVPMKTPYVDKAAIPLYPGVAPGSENAKQVEAWATAPGDIVARNVTRPTITPYIPSRSKATGAAVVVLPGGGNVVLSMGREGYDVAKFLQANGVAAFVLKYRTNETPSDMAKMPPMPAGVVGRPGAGGPPPGGMPNAPRLSVNDGQEALRWVRANAAKYGVDPNRVGMVGFSAGAGNVWSVTFANDATAMPNFIAPIYGGFAARGAIPANPPPLFVAAAADDNLIQVGGGFPVVEAWTKAGGKVELHLYQNGGHGFGAAKKGTSSDMFLDQFLLWMKVNGFLTKR